MVMTAATSRLGSASRAVLRSSRVIATVGAGRVPSDCDVIPASLRTTPVGVLPVGSCGQETNRRYSQVEFAAAFFVSPAHITRTRTRSLGRQDESNQM
jgi:hypothetical protein